MILNSSMDSSVGVLSRVMLEPTSTLLAPSTNQLMALRRAPLMDRLTVLVSPSPTSSVSELLTPGTRVASWTKLRLLRGNSWTWVEPIRFCTAGLGWMSWEEAVTSTASVMPCTPSTAPTSRRSLTCRLMFLATWVLNPASEKLISYSPFVR